MSVISQRVCLCQDEVDVGPVREIDVSTFDERSSRQRQHLAEPTSCNSATHSQTEMTNGTISEGTRVLLHRKGKGKGFAVLDTEPQCTGSQPTCDRKSSTRR